MTIAPVPGHVTEQLYHGTAASLNPGDHVMPGKKVGYSHYGTVGHSGQKSNQHAFATTDEHTAWNFAENASGHTGDRGRVYKVEPGPKTRPGVYNTDHPKYDGENLHEYISSRFPVTKQIDIRPEHQGTFPQINWKQHSTLQSWAGDANHPDPHEVENGHYGSNRGESHLDRLVAHDQADKESKEARHMPGQGELWSNHTHNMLRLEHQVAVINDRTRNPKYKETTWG